MDIPTKDIQSTRKEAITIDDTPAATGSTFNITNATNNPTTPLMSMSHLHQQSSSTLPPTRCPNNDFAVMMTTSHVVAPMMMTASARIDLSDEVSSQSTANESGSKTGELHGDEKCDTAPEHVRKCDGGGDNPTSPTLSLPEEQTLTTATPTKIDTDVPSSPYTDVGTTTTTTTSANSSDNSNITTPAESTQTATPNNGSTSTPDEAEPSLTMSSSASMISAKSALAFTIDFDDAADRSVNSKKYNEIFERFQRRHRRGASMSKLEENDGDQRRPQSAEHNAGAATALIGRKVMLRKSPSSTLATTSSGKVGVQLRDKSRLSRRDASAENRHSWSPRNSGGAVVLQQQQQHVLVATQRTASPSSSSTNANPSKHVFRPKSTALQRAIESVQQNQQHSASTPDDHGIDIGMIVCPVPPLEFRAPSSSDSSVVSEAGTYTLDGDNYTEEQKQQMSIDKYSKLAIKPHTDTTATVHPDVETSTAKSTTSAGKTKPSKPTSYLERIKSKVRNISDRTFHQNKQHQYSQPAAVQHTTAVNNDSMELPQQMSQYMKHPPPDTLDLVGNFTSITSAGAFSKQTPHQRQIAGRRSSLTQSQIDKSEYIQPQPAENLSFTDFEKATFRQNLQHIQAKQTQHEYQLNMFHNPQAEDSEAQISPTHVGNDSLVSSSTATTNDTSSSSFGLDRVETKNDWIQEWAKNARRNTKKASTVAQATEHLPNVVPQPSRPHSNTMSSDEKHQTTIQRQQHQHSSSGFSNNNTETDILQQYGRNARNVMTQHANIRYIDDPMTSGRKARDSVGSLRTSESPVGGQIQRYGENSGRNEFGYDDIGYRGYDVDDDVGLDENDADDGYVDDNRSDAELSSYHQRIREEEQRQQLHHQQQQMEQQRRDFYADYANGISRPPVSPSKIPSPMHSLPMTHRPRSASMNRNSLHSSLTELDGMSHLPASKDNDDTGMYLHKTAAAINQLQNIHHRNHNSRSSPGSPQQLPHTHVHGGKIASNFMTSPSVRRHYKHSPFATLSPEHQATNTGRRPPASPTGRNYAHDHGSNTSLHRQQLPHNNNAYTFRNQKTTNSPQHQQSHHRRNHSLDNTESFHGSRQHVDAFRSDNVQSFDMTDIDRDCYPHHRQTPLLFDTPHQSHPANRQHTRHNSYEPSQQQYRSSVVMPAVQPQSTACIKVRSKSANVTPATIKRSSSFSVKPLVRPSSSGHQPTSTSTATKATTPKISQRIFSQSNDNSNGNIPARLQKSASSNSFKNIPSSVATRSYNACGDFFVNDTDNLYAADDYSSESEFSDLASGTTPPIGTTAAGRVPSSSSQQDRLTNARYNKAFLARLEQNKPLARGNVSGHNGSGAPNNGAATMKQGVMACPNTPEMPRRDMRARQSLRDRASMPRDSSINRMKQELNVSVAATSARPQKRGQLETATRSLHMPAHSQSNRNDEGIAAGPQPTVSATVVGGSGGRVLPKYLDISKYKPQQGNTFLRRDESRSTLLPQHKEVRRSTSSFGVGALNRTSAEPGRSSVRSGSASNTSKSTPMSTSKDEATREADLAMWRRRASYDPMKAAAEGKRKLDAKKASVTNTFNESSSSTSLVIRSQSFHNGVGPSAPGLDASAAAGLELPSRQQ